MNLRLDIHLVAAALFGSVLACGGGGGGFKDPGHQASAEQATKLSGIGDSIMQGMDTACDGSTPTLEDHTACSFAQGNGGDIFSLYWRYKVIAGLAGGEEFVSVSGSTMMDDAYPQATQICAQSTKPNRIVILLGGNDVCIQSDVTSLPTAKAFGDALTGALSKLASVDCGLPSGIRVHVLSMPRINHLFSATSGKSCHSFLEILCPIVTGTNQQRQEVQDRIDAYNGAISDTVAAANSAYHHADDDILFSTDWNGTSNPSIGTHVFVSSDISDVDCFHPSAQGQNMLACAAWESWEGLGNASNCP